MFELVNALVQQTNMEKQKEGTHFVKVHTWYVDG